MRDGKKLVKVEYKLIKTWWKVIKVCETWEKLWKFRKSSIKNGKKWQKLEKVDICSKSWWKVVKTARNAFSARQ